MQHSRAVWTAVGIRMFSSCRRQNEGDERLALKRHLMVNMTNLRAKAKPVEREMSYSALWWRDHFSSFTSILSGLHLEIR